MSWYEVNWWGELGREMVNSNLVKRWERMSLTGFFFIIRLTWVVGRVLIKERVIGLCRQDCLGCKVYIKLSGVK